MKHPRLTKKDHELRRKLVREMGAKPAFDFVVAKALDRERAGKR